MPLVSTWLPQKSGLAGEAQAGRMGGIGEGGLGTVCLQELQEAISSAAKITWGNVDCCHAQLWLFPFLVKDSPSGSGQSEGKVSPQAHRSVGCILQAASC